MRELDDKKKVEDNLKEFRRLSHNHVLMIDGKTLTTILDEPSVESSFFEEAIKAPCVCVCRCSPT